MGKVIKPLVLLCLAALSAPALAQEEAPQTAEESANDERARALYEEGTRLYDQGLYEEATQAFKIAFALSRRPLLLYNMAQSMERIGQWDEALAALEDYRLDAEDSELPTLDSRINALKERIDERDAKKAAETPAPAPVVVARRGPPAGSWALFGVGAAGVGVGAVFTGSALGARSDWSEPCVDGKAGLTCPEGSADAFKKDNRSSLVADIGWIVGVGAIGGGVAIALGSKGGANDVRLAAGPRGIRLGGRW